MAPEDTIPNSPSRIVLVGFMGAGKSTAGPLLAHHLNWRFVDADHHLEASTGSTIAELFSQNGETSFRQMEAEAVAKLHQSSSLVLALGGGAIETESTRTLLYESDDTCVVFLRAPLEILLARCQQQPGASVRPLLRQPETLNQRFDARSPHYERAHITIDTEGIDPDHVVKLIVTELAESFSAPSWKLKAATS